MFSCRNKNNINTYGMKKAPYLNYDCSDIFEIIQCVNDEKSTLSEL